MSVLHETVASLYVLSYRLRFPDGKLYESSTKRSVKEGSLNPVEKSPTEVVIPKADFSTIEVTPFTTL